ncbi:MAG: DNA replication complex subunit Gins51 [Promethearchaeota archaeon]
MEPFELEQIYKKLIIKWEIESNTSELNELSNEELNKFKILQQEVHLLEKSDIPEIFNEEEVEIYTELRNELAKLVDFLVNDILDLRIDKILEKCEELEVINEDLLLSNELEFYRNVISAFKGYKKTRNIYEVIADACKTEPSRSEEIAVCNLEEKEWEPDRINYILIEAIQDIPPLVGLDFKNYGPFKEGDVGYIPEINAQILAKERAVNILKNFNNNNNVH